MIRQLIGGFTQIVRDGADLIYCEIQKFYIGDQFSDSRLICIYSLGNLDGFPIYKSGRPGYDCIAGRNPQFKGLCCYNEPFAYKW